MPTAELILASLENLARSWWGIALAWHLYLLALALVLFACRALSLQVAALALTAPLASAALLALVGRNPFNSVALGAVLAGALFVSWRLPKRDLEFSTRLRFVGGVAMIGFGLLYPHFLEPASPLTYAYAAPFGIIPCPTLSVLVGASLATNLSTSRAWSWLVGAAGIFYGLIGALYLHVWLDLALAAGSSLLILAALLRKPTDPALATRTHCR